MSELKHNVYFLNQQRGKSDYPLFIFVPGLNETEKRLMFRQTSSLKTSFDVCCLVIPPENFDNWELLVKSVLALIEAELAKTPRRLVYLCGESFGGCLALKMLLQAPNWFDKIILVNSASSFHRVLWLNLGSLLLPLISDCIYYNSAFFSLLFLASIDKISDRACQDLANTIKFSSKKITDKRIGMMRDFTLDEITLQKVKQPILLIGSREDLILPSVEEINRLAKIFPQATLVTLPHSGHACLVEEDINLYQIMKANNFIV